MVHVLNTTTYNIVEEKKRCLGRHSDDTSSKLPRSLANRLGPSPGLHGRVGRSVQPQIMYSSLIAVTSTCRCD